jgi:hypothetical protein
MGISTRANTAPKVSGISTVPEKYNTITDKINNNNKRIEEERYGIGMILIKKQGYINPASFTKLTNNNLEV